MRIVGLIIESSRAYGRGLLHGIARFARTHNNWSIVYRESMLADSITDVLAKSSCNGVLARIETIQQRNALLKLKIPVVDLRGRWVTKQFPQLICDQKAVAELAAQHLLGRGYRRFAFCGFAGADYSQHRMRYFAQAIRHAGYDLSIYESPAAPHRAGTNINENRAMAYEAEMADWLRQLPVQTGIMACNDVCGRLVLNLCHKHHLDVPNHIAVIGVDNDELLCDLAAPAMSSISLPTERLGFQAAELLAGMMDGKKSAHRKILLPPIDVIVRRSTDFTVAEDPYVVAAMAYIREKACARINVDHILDHLASKNMLISRSTLDRRFQHALHCLPKDQILNFRMRAVRQLLLDTTYSLERIAGMVGVSRDSQLAAQFKRHTGQTPGDFRNNARMEPARAKPAPR